MFISSARPDEDFALGVLADGLARAGLRVHHRGKFVPGRPLLDELEHAVQHSEHVVAVLSPSYLSDEFAAFERVLGQHAAVEDRRKLLIPVIYRHAELPPLLRVLVHVDCTDPAEWNQAIEQLCRTLGRPAPSAPEAPACPYPGLSPFTEQDHRLFFGRDDEIDMIVGRLSRRRRALLVGPSGSGKSSLVFAGVVPRLGRSALLPGEWSVRVTRPGRPEAPVFGGEPHRLLVIDQLEELFTVPESDRDAVRGLVERDDCAVIATMRADFYGDLMASDLWDVLRDHRVEIPPLHRDALEEAIRRPALEVGVYVEAELARKLVDDAGGEPGMMPLVQETMRDLWDHLEWRFLPLSAYVLPRRTYGRPPRTGLHRALEAHAEAAYTQLSSAQRNTAFRLFVRLVQPIAGRASVRRRCTMAQLEEIADDPQSLRATIDALVDARLLTLSGDGHVDLAHEALITGWSRLGEWIEQAGQAEVVRGRLEAKAARWRELGYRGGLLDAIELAEAQQWLASLDAQRLGADKSIRDLVAASADALEASTRRTLAIRNRWIGAVSLVAVAALVAAMIAIWKGGEASRNARDAKATELAAIADGLAGQSLDLALLLSIEAYHRKPVPESVATLVNTLGRVPSLERVLHGHTEEVRAVAVTRDGKTVASAGRDDRIVLWDADGNEIRRLSGHTDEVHGLAFTPDGATLVSTSSDRTIRRWVVATGAETGPSSNGHTAEIRGAAVDPKGRWIASASHDRTARLWNLSTGAELSTFREHTEAVLDVAFSPDGDLLASAGEDGRVIVRSPSGQQRAAHDFGVPARAVVFNPANAALLAIALNDGTTMLWDLATEPVVLTRSSERVFDVAFAPDGTRLAAASRDQVITVVDLADRQVRRLDGHGGDVRSVVFFPDGTRLVSGSRDATVMLWNLDRPQRLATATITSGAPIALQYQARGAEVLSVNQNGTAETFAGTTGDKIRSVVLAGASDVVAAAVSPDGALVALGSRTGVVGVWRADNGSPLWVPAAGHDADVRALCFSSDGALLISGGGDAQAKMWEVATGEARQAVRFDFPVADVAFGPGGSALTTDQNGTMWGWSRDDAAPRRQEVSDNRIRSIHIGLSTDGDTVAAGTSQDRIEVRRIGADLRASTVTEIDHIGDLDVLATGPPNRVATSDITHNRVRVWDLGSGKALGELPVSAPGVLALSPDGAGIAVATGGGVQIWDLRPDRLLAAACALANRNLTAQERAFYLGSGNAKTCPDLP